MLRIPEVEIAETLGIDQAKAKSAFLTMFDKPFSYQTPQDFAYGRLAGAVMFCEAGQVETSACAIAASKQCRFHRSIYAILSGEVVGQACSERERDCSAQKRCALAPLSDSDFFLQTAETRRFANICH